MAKSSAKAYLGLDWIVSLILAIIPFTNVVLGVITRVQRNNLLMAILNIVLAPIFYIIDLVSIILNKDLVYFA
jgi:hypothetical protein